MAEKALWEFHFCEALRGLWDAFPNMGKAKFPEAIEATTVGTGGDWSSNNNVFVPIFLSVVFKKQEISQRVVTRMQDLASEFSKNFRG